LRGHARLGSGAAARRLTRTHELDLRTFSGRARSNLDAEQRAIRGELGRRHARVDDSDLGVRVRLACACGAVGVVGLRDRMQLELEPRGPVLRVVPKPAGRIDIVVDHEVVRTEAVDAHGSGLARMYADDRAGVRETSRLRRAGLEPCAAERC
jgi:hypothetical protein